MAYAGVVAVSLLVATVVYVVSLREPQEEAAPRGFLPEEQVDTGWDPAIAGGVPTEHVTYVPLAVAGRLTLRTRLAGVFGIVVLVACAATALALGLYQAGHIVNQTIAKFFGKG
jgi:hypothetical protein